MKGFSALIHSNPGHFPGKVHGMTLQIFASVQVKMRLLSCLKLATAYLNWLWIRIYTTTPLSTPGCGYSSSCTSAILYHCATIRTAHQFCWESNSKDLATGRLPGRLNPPQSLLQPCWNTNLLSGTDRLL